MKQKSLFLDILTIGFALFSMFFGAGNVIFPPFLGMQSGGHWFGGLTAFFVADVVLAVLALFAMFRAGSAEGLLGSIGSRAAVILLTVIVLCNGPLLAIPRTAATTFEIGVSELIPLLSPVTFSVFFFLLVLVLSIRESAVVDVIGKILTPLLLIGLAVLIVDGMIQPIGTISETAQVDSVPMNGIRAGYQTLDVMGALVLGPVLIRSAEARGYRDKKQRMKLLVGASAVAALLLLLVYLGLTYLGATASEIFSSDVSRTALIMYIVQRILGRPGLIIFTVVVALACITTAIGLTCACATYLSGLTKGRGSYKLFVVIICIFSAVISNLSLDTIISVSAPILELVYPVVLVLTAVSLVAPHLSRQACIAAVLGATVMNILFTVDSMGLSMPWLHALPLAGIDMIWILPSLLCGVIATVSFRRFPLARQKA